jgi:hypothetical protein
VVSSFEYDIEDHLPYLCEQNDKKYFASFTPKTQKLVDARKKAHCGNLAPILKNAPTYPSGANSATISASGAAEQRGGRRRP